MALTRKEYTGNGSTTLYNVDFDLGYIDKDYVYVYLEGSQPNDQLQYVWRNNNQIELINPVDTGKKFYIRRLIPRDQLVNDYEDGAILREGNLNDSYLQVLMILEEVQDGFITVDDEFLVLAKIVLAQDLDMGGFRITNLPVPLTSGEPLRKGDAAGDGLSVSKEYVDGQIENIDNYLKLRIFQSPADGGLTEIQTRTVDAGEVYEVRKASNNSLATLYSDAAGTTEITQDGTSNVSGSDGVIKFFIDDGDYTVTSGSASSGLYVSSFKAKIDDDSVARVSNNIVIGDNSQPNSVSKRDAFQVLRTVSETDRHGFADRTIMSGVSDSGTYGTFDCVVTVQGGHNQDHIYSFQNRSIYDGDGSLNFMSGLYSSPTHSGSGTIGQRNGVEVRDINVSGSGSVSANIGVFIRDLSSGSSNVGINCGQSTGYTMFMAGGAKSYHKGQIGIGIDNNDNAAVAISNSKTAGADKRLVLDTNSGGGVIAISGDNTIEIGMNSATRYKILNSSGNYSIEPATDLTGGVGSAGKRVDRVYSGRFYFGGGAFMTSGSGSPEGVVNAPIGSIYTDLTGGVGTTLYVKESGTGNAGWVAK